MNKIFYNKRSRLSAVKMFYMLVYLENKYGGNMYKKYPKIMEHIIPTLDVCDVFTIIDSVCEERSK